jgi:hypothetical protein
VATLKINLSDATGADLTDHIVVDLFPVQGVTPPLQATADVRGSMQIDNIDISGGPLYRVMITPANHRIVQGFVSLSDGRPTKFDASVPVNPGKVSNVTAPVFEKLAPKTRDVLSQATVPRFNDGAGGFLQGAKLYAALDRFPLLKGCFLNIIAKSAATILPDSKRVVDHFKELLRLEQDRLFLRTSAALLEETSASHAFHAAPSNLHEPLPDFRIVSSFKTFDKYGNLQLTFQRRGNTGDHYAVDVDIDDAQGIEHIFQVLRNSVHGPTNPFDIHEILLRQTPPVDPGYGFVFAAKAQIAASSKH